MNYPTIKRPTAAGTAPSPSLLVTSLPSAPFLLNPVADPASANVGMDEVTAPKRRTSRTQYGLNII